MVQVGDKLLPLSNFFFNTKLKDYDAYSLYIIIIYQLQV